LGRDATRFRDVQHNGGVEVTSARGRTTVVLAVVTTLVAAGVFGGWLVTRDDEPGRSGQKAIATVTPTPTPTPAPSIEPAKRIAGGVVIKRRPYCEMHAPRPMTPLRISIPGVTRSAPVMALARDQFGIPGVPPVSDSGKWAFGWDAPGLRPGVARGNAIMTAHTYPDGSALGNFLLSGFQEGDRMTVYGPGREKLCYRLFDRVQVPFNVSGDRFYDEVGPHDLVFIVCSGTRLGPGEWTHRTMFYSRLVRQRS
jgi:hypothetical protein